jgi:hypothetical protein
MNGTNSGWPGMANPAAMAGMAGYGGLSDPTGTALANMTPEQQQAYRQRLYGQALMGQSSSAPQRSGWGAMSNAMNPILGAAMSLYGKQPTNQVGSGTPNLMWNPNNPVGTETLGGATANQGWLANNFGGLFG